MKKVKIFGVSFLIVFVCWYGYFQFYPLQHTITTTLSINVNSIVELEQVSDMIVVAKMKQKMRTNIDRDSLLNVPEYGNTETSFKVSKTYKGDIESDEIIVREDYFTYTNPFGQQVVTSYEGYIPAKNGTEYLLFLKRYADGNLYLAGAYQGKYKVLDAALEQKLLNTQLLASDLEVSEVVYENKYKKLWDEAASKYFQK